MCIKSQKWIVTMTKMDGRSRTFRYRRLGPGTTRSQDIWVPDVSVPQLLPDNPASIYLKDTLFHSLR